jgi:DNA ligase-1
MEIAEILKQIASTSKAGEKKAILAANKGNETLRQVFEYTYHPDKIYGVKKAAVVKSKEDKDFETIWLYFSTILEQCSKRELTGNNARGALDTCLSMTDAENQKWLIQILKKDLKIGLGLSEAIKVWPGLVPVFDCVLAKHYKDFKKKVNLNSGEWLVMRKLDGYRLISQNAKAGPSFFTREGHNLASIDKFEKDVAVFTERFGKVNSEFTIDGEICAVDKDGNESFKAISKLDRSGYTTAIKAFDYLTNEEFDSGKSAMKYSERMDALKEFLAKTKLEGVIPIEYERVTSKEVLERWQAVARENNWEGLILRKDVVYENGRIADLLKVKDYIDEEFVVEGIETDKLTYTEKDKGIVEYDCLKSIYFSYKGNRVYCGSGFNKEERIEYFKDPSQIIGKLVTIRYFEPTENDKGTCSLRFPTYRGIRLDITKKKGKK